MSDTSLKQSDQTEKAVHTQARMIRIIHYVTFAPIKLNHSQMPRLSLMITVSLLNRNQ